MMRLVICLALVSVAASPAVAQGLDSLLALGAAAETDGDVREAVRQYERLERAHPEEPEPKYRLSRLLYTADEVQDPSRARRLIQQAVALDPDNPTYLVSELEQLKEKGWNFFMDMARATRRAEIAKALLAMDSTDAFAHEELAVTAIRDYYQYQNAIALPGVEYFSPTYDPDYAEESFGERSLPQGDTDNLPSQTVAAQRTYASDRVSATQNTAASGSLGSTGDRLDADRLLALGAVSYRARADAALETATFHLTRALDADPGRRSLYDEVMRMSAIAGDWAFAMGALQQMVEQFPDDPETWLYLGLATHRTGAADAAAAAFQNGLERMDPETRAAYADLTLILSPEEVRAYRADPETFASRYWTARDPRFLSPSNERRHEHYARLTEAELLYLSEDLGIPGWGTERGQIYVRYGKPQTDVVIEGDFNRFLEQYQDRDVQFVENEFLLASNRINLWDYGAFQMVFEDPNRSGEFALYTPPADLFGQPSAGRIEQMDYILRADEVARETPELYTYEDDGVRVDIPARTTSFRGEGGRSDVYVHLGIPLGVASADGTGPINTTIQTGTFLISAENDMLAESRRTVYGLRRDGVVGFDAVSLWITSESLDAAPGEVDVAVEFETADGRVSGANRQTVTVDAYPEGELALSDLLLAYAVEETAARVPGRISRGGTLIQPAPWGVFKLGEPVAVYFEVYGLTPTGATASYEVSAQLLPKDTSSGIGRLARRIFGGTRRGVSTSFPATADGADDGRYLLLDATGQEPGVYVLTLEIRDEATGQSVSKQADVLLE